MSDTRGFTPLQRRQCFTIASYQNANKNANWTATRCQRLLRPITSRIEALKKDSIRVTAPEIGIVSIHGIQSEFAESKFQNEFCSTRREGGDPEWVPGRKRVRIKRTYGRSRPSQEEARPKHARMQLAPGEISIPTPILSRCYSAPSFKDCYSSKSEAPIKLRYWKHRQSRHNIKQTGENYQLAEVMKTISKTAHPTRFALYEGLYNALEALLKATDMEASDRGPRPRSLFSLCLRNVPSYIKEEEQWIASEADGTRSRSILDQQDISTEVYAELESLGTSEKGWKNLMVVARAHGIYLLKNAIAEGLLETKFASALVMLCTHTGCLDEAKLLLSSLLERQYPEPDSVQTRMLDDGPMSPLTTLAMFAKHAGNNAYQYRELSKLLARGLLPKSWLATRDFSATWTGIFHSLSIQSPNQQEAKAFLATVLPLLCRDRSCSDELSSALDATLVSGIRIITSMCILQDTNTFSSGAIQLSSLRNLLRGITIDCNDQLPSLDDTNLSIIAVSNLVIPAPLNTSIQKDTKTLSPFIKLIQQARSSTQHAKAFEDRLSNFVCSIARCCGRCATDQGFEHLKIILERVQSLITDDTFDPSHDLRRIAIGCGFTFSQQLPDQNHIQYAEILEAKLQGPLIQPRTSPASVSIRCKPGFRWEEGISEWVTATPAISSKRSMPTACSSVSDDDDSEVQSSRITMLKHPRQTIRAHPGVLTNSTRWSSCNKLFDLVPPSPDAFASEREKPQSGFVCDTDRASWQPIFQNGITRTNARRSVTKTKRFGRGLLQSQQEWKLFDDDSDDELNSSVLSQPDSTIEVLAELRNSDRSKRQPDTKDCSGRSRSQRIIFDFTAESEDELSMMSR